tara:strand:- start:40 stop:330 length:291 start_codon:yes stop_codon:yes gene_type:complete
MSQMIKQLGSNRTLLDLGNVQILYSYETPVLARLEDGSFLRSKNYYKNGTTRTTEKHITQTLNFFCIEYGLQIENLNKPAELVDQQEIEDLIPLRI